MFKPKKNIKDIKGKTELKMNKETPKITRIESKIKIPS